MFELLLITALGQMIALPAAPEPPTAPVAAISGDPGLDAQIATPPALANPTNNTWRASVEAASVANDSAHSRSVIERPTPFAATTLAEPVNPTIADGSYDAMLAKRWHWFELYGVSRLHRIPKESRMPWWFSY